MISAFSELLPRTDSILFPPPAQRGGYGRNPECLDATVMKCADCSLTRSPIREFTLRCAACYKLGEVDTYPHEFEKFVGVKQ
jgi:hypothetical protein